MVLRIFSSIILIFMVFFKYQPCLSEVLEGRFRGYLIPKHAKFKFPLQIDFYLIKADLYSSILRMNLGYNTSHEYISQYYKNVSYNKINHSISMISEGWDINLSQLKLENNVLHGKFISNSGYQQGSITLFRVNNQKSISEENKSHISERKKLNTIPTFPLITGQYEGTCDGQKYYLQLEASKWYSILEPIQTPFYGYKFTGRLARQNDYCGEKKPCIENNFFDGTFNPFSGYMKLEGSPKDLSIYYNYPLIEFDNCQVKKIKDLNITLNKSDEPQIKNNFHQIHKDHSDEINPQNVTIEGAYVGHLLHHQLNKYQNMEIHIQSHDSYKETQRFLYPKVWLKLGNNSKDHRTFDYISFTFKKVPYHSNARESQFFSDINKKFIFWHTGSDVIIKINTLSNEEISGVWISKTFGVVGPFRVLRQNIKSAQINIKYPNIFGTYENDLWTLKFIGLEDRSPLDIANFFPFQLTGDAFSHGLTEKKSIKNGVYDMYTGALVFKLSDNRLLIGRSASNKIKIFWPSIPKWGVRLNNMTLQDLEKKK